MASLHYLTSYLTRLHLDPDDIASLTDLRTRDGFIIVKEDELSQIIDFFNPTPVLGRIIPILTDGQSNCICIYKSGPLKGFICEWDHEETDITPRFSSITSLVKAINLFTESSEINEFPDEAFDYPSRNRLSSTEKEKVIITQLRHDLAIESNEDIRIQLAFCIMALTPIRDLEQLYPFLDHEDMYIQERAIEIMGFYRHQPAKEKLISLATTAKHNGRLAVQTVLRNWTNSSNDPFIW